MKWNFYFSLFSILISGGTIVYAIAKFNAITGNELKHYKERFEKIEDWQKGKSSFMDKLNDRLIKLETKFDDFVKINNRR
jgi:hypothetical protein